MDLRPPIVNPRSAGEFWMPFQEGLDAYRPVPLYDAFVVVLCLQSFSDVFVVWGGKSHSGSLKLEE